MKESTAFKLVKDELDRAVGEHLSMHSAHEGWAVIREEVDELWEEVKKDGVSHRATSEAVQIAAMAVRYLIDLCDEETAVAHESKAVKHKVETRSYGGYSG